MFTLSSLFFWRKNSMPLQPVKEAVKMSLYEEVCNTHTSTVTGLKYYIDSLKTNSESANKAVTQNVVLINELVHKNEVLKGVISKNDEIINKLSSI